MTTITGPWRRAVFNIAGSLFVTVLTIAAIELCSHFVFPIPSPSPILLIAVVFSSFACGMPSGFLSAISVIAYGMYAFHDRPAPQFYSDLNTARLITLAVTAPTMAILVGLLRFQIQKSTTRGVVRHSEERFRQALINAPVPVMMHTEDGQILLINDEWTRLSGYTLIDTPRLKDWLRLAHREKAEQIAAGVKRLFELPHGASEEDFEIRTKSGEQRVWTATVSAPGTLSDGRRYVVVMARDTTQAKRDDQELAQQARVLETINRTNELLAGELDINKLVQRLTDAGRQLSGAEFGAFFYNVIDERGEAYMLYTLSGAPREAFEKFPMPRNTEIFAPTFSGKGVVRLDDVTKDPRYGKNDPFKGKPPGHLPVHSYLAVPVVSRSGEVIGGLFYGHSQPAMFGPQAEQLLVGIAAQAAVAIDNARLYQAAQQELAERKRAEAALLEASERTRLAVLSADVGTWDFNPVSGELRWSDRCKAAFGLPREADVSYDVFLRALHPDDRERTDAAVKKSLDPHSDGEYEIDYRTIWPDQTVHWIIAKGRAFFEGEGAQRKAIRFIGTVLDITDRKEAELRVARAKEHAEAANQAKDQFLAALSHELRTPLTPVLLTATALENDDQLSEKARAEVSLIRRNVELEARLIDDLLDLTRVSRGKLKLDLRPTDPIRAMRAALEVCEDDLQTKGLQLTMQSPPDTMCVRADPARLQQIFWNLIKNAVKFTPAGGRVQVRCEMSGEKFRAYVSDSGIGIEPDLLPRIFDAFEQGGDKVSRQFGGLGLGLAICKVLIDMHGGKLTAASAGKNRGATFSVELPLISARAMLQRTPPADPRRAGKPLRILLVEDHDPTSRVLSLLLRQMNHQVTAAPTVADALRQAEKSQFDLLISDLGLPDGTGLDLMRQLREKYRITGIALSGYGMDQDIADSREAGFVEHLIKPVDLPRLKSAIESVTT